MEGVPAAARWGHEAINHEERPRCGEVRPWKTSMASPPCTRCDNQATS
jgi:hypothetical protein